MTFWKYDLRLKSLCVCKLISLARQSLTTPRFFCRWCLNHANVNVVRYNAFSFQLIMRIFECHREQKGRKKEKVKLTRLVFAGVLNICIYTLFPAAGWLLLKTVFCHLSFPLCFTQIVYNGFTAVRPRSLLCISQLWSQTVFYEAKAKCLHNGKMWSVFFCYTVIDAHYEPCHWSVWVN